MILQLLLQSCVVADENRVGDELPTSLTPTEEERHRPSHERRSVMREPDFDRTMLLTQHVQREGAPGDDQLCARQVRKIAQETQIQPVIMPLAAHQLPAHR